ncbi:hypothetical protein [Zavarzinella formosa]|uniref:hypothetical protein n=1 Tax=Zavarzinella formosa TaxID=360055 RepID=UPI0002F5C76F|nr:hypothetical protein [Zavarzinella formosa]
MDLFPESLFLLPIVVIGYYLGFPLLIYANQKFPARPKMTELDMEGLDPDHAEFFMRQTRAVIKLGFDEPTLVQMDNAAPLVSTYLIMLVNRPTGDKAMVTVIVGRGDTPEQTAYLEFSTRFDSGEVFDTHNSATLSAFPPGPQTVRTQVPMVTDPRELFELHTYVMGKHLIASKKFVYEPGQALEYLIRYAFIKTYDIQVSRGWLWLDPNTDAYRLTLRGAFLIVWGLQQPFKTFRKMILNRRATRTLQEFRQARDV